MKKLTLLGVIGAYLFVCYGCSGQKEEFYDPKNWPSANGKPGGKPPPGVVTLGIEPDPPPAAKVAPTKTPPPEKKPVPAPETR